MDVLLWYNINSLYNLDITKYIRMRTKVKNGPDYGFDVDDIGGEI